MEKLWTHPICLFCFMLEEPGRAPDRVSEGYRQTERCCFCGDETKDGIYYQKHPALMGCEGRHQQKTLGSETHMIQ